jgi:hypothetical protein
MNPYWLGGAILGLILFGAAGAHLWQDKARNAKLDSLLGDNRVLQGNFDTCEEANVTNLQTIYKQAASIDAFILAQNKAVESHRLLAEELAARQLRDNEASRRTRVEVREVLSAEACAAVEHPARVHRLLNAAIAKASRGAD